MSLPCPCFFGEDSGFPMIIITNFLEHKIELFFATYKKHDVVLKSRLKEYLFHNDVKDPFEISQKYLNTEYVTITTLSFKFISV